MGVLRKCTSHSVFGGDFDRSKLTQLMSRHLSVYLLGLATVRRRDDLCMGCSSGLILRCRAERMTYFPFKMGMYRNFGHEMNLPNEEKVTFTVCVAPRFDE